MPQLPERLRDLYRRSASNHVTDFSLLIEAAATIERLQRQIADTDEWMRENLPQHYASI